MTRSKATSRKRVVGSLPRDTLQHPEPTIKRQSSSTGRSRRRTQKQRLSSPSPARTKSQSGSRSGSPVRSHESQKQQAQLNYNVPSNSEIFSAALAACMVKASEIQE